MTIDLARAVTAPFTPTAEHETLAGFVGAWRGTCQLWLDPEAPPEESELTLHAELLLGGRWLRLCTSGTSLGQRHAGEMLLGYHRDTQSHELAWVDSFHTGTSIMLSSGLAGAPGVVDVLGSYAAGDQRWGWRTRLWLAAPDELVFEAFNIEPGSAEEHAFASRLRRV